MNQEEKESLQYRFSGYQLPMIQLDETGPAYYVLDPHPYYYGQPTYWQKPAYYGNQLPACELIEGQPPINGTGNVAPPAVEEGHEYVIIPPMLPLI